MAPGAVGFVPLAVSGSLKPGKYTGALELEADNATRTSIPVTIDVKKPLWWAVLLILICCLLRVIVQVAARGRTLAGPARTLTRLRRRAKTLDPSYRDALTPVLDRLSQLIYIDRDLAEASALSPTSRSRWPARRSPRALQGRRERRRRVRSPGRRTHGGGGGRGRQPARSQPHGGRARRRRPLLRGHGRAAQDGRRGHRREPRGTRLGLDLPAPLARRGARALRADLPRAQGALPRQRHLRADVLLDDAGLVVWTLGANAAGKALGALTPAR